MDRSFKRSTSSSTAATQVSYESNLCMPEWCIFSQSDVSCSELSKMILFLSSEQGCLAFFKLAKHALNVRRCFSFPLLLVHFSFDNFSSKHEVSSPTKFR